MRTDEPFKMWTLLAAGLCTLMPLSTARTALVALFVYLFACTPLHSLRVPHELTEISRFLLTRYVSFTRPLT